MAYYYKGRRYPSKPALKMRVKVTLKDFASRAWESIQGDHPAGGEAYVERLIREYPERPVEPAPAPNKSDE
jgi:hypothetical protein